MHANNFKKIIKKRKYWKPRNFENLKNFKSSKYFRFSIFTNTLVMRSILRILHFILGVPKFVINFSNFDFPFSQVGATA